MPCSFSCQQKKPWLFPSLASFFPRTCDLLFAIGQNTSVYLQKPIISYFLHPFETFPMAFTLLPWKAPSFNPRYENMLHLYVEVISLYYQCSVVSLYLKLPWSFLSAHTQSYSPTNKSIISSGLLEHMIVIIFC